MKSPVYPVVRNKKRECDGCSKPTWARCGRCGMPYCLDCAGAHCDMGWPTPAERGRH